MKLKHDVIFVCLSCMHPVNAESPEKDYIIDGHALEIVPTFCYLGDIIGNNGSCSDAITARLKSAWKNSGSSY